MADVGQLDQDVVRRCRHEAALRTEELGHPDLVDDVALVASELVTNALLHGGGVVSFKVTEVGGCLRVEVGDRSPTPPMVGLAGDAAMTGRGLALVTRLAARWGAETVGGGKVVWADVREGLATTPGVGDLDSLLASAEDLFGGPGLHRYEIVLGDVPTDLLLAAKTHVENLVREFTLLALAERTGGPVVPPHLSELLQTVVRRFADARLAIKQQALASARAEAPLTHLVLHLPLEAADAAEEYLAALDAVDAYSRARRLLTAETPQSHRAFRRWYVEELVRRLRAAARGETAEGVSFQQGLVAEVDRLGGVQRASERAVRLYDVARALAAAASADDVVHAVLHEGVAALGAHSAAVLVVAPSGAFHVAGAVGHADDVLARLEGEPTDAQLPGAVAHRTGGPVWVESLEERDRRFPDLVTLQPGTVAMCALPLAVGGRPLGALRLGFDEAHLFDRHQRAYAEALAAVAAQALVRTALFTPGTRAPAAEADP